MFHVHLPTGGECFRLNEGDLVEGDNCDDLRLNGQEDSSDDDLSPSSSLIIKLDTKNKKG